MEIFTEYDGYYYLSHVPLGVYEFGPDPEQLESAGLVAQPATRRLVLENLDDFPPPEDFDLIRLTDLNSEVVHQSDNTAEPELSAALPDNDLPINSDSVLSAISDVSWEETRSNPDDSE